jgi:hypothetical protein
MPKQSDDLSREGEQSQKTDKGLEIPGPKRKDFGRFINGLKRDARRFSIRPRKASNIPRALTSVRALGVSPITYR